MDADDEEFEVVEVNFTEDEESEDSGELMVAQGHTEIRVSPAVTCESHVHG